MNCKYCNTDMSTSEGCVRIPIIHNGVEYEPIKVGDDGDWITDKNKHCHDCNATYGNYHHAGCDNERCPVCGSQLISCGCIDEDLNKIK